MRRLICLVFVITILLIGMPGKSYCYAADSTREPNDPKYELEWDYFTHTHFRDRYIDTVSVHMLENISQTNNRSVYRGITVTRPYGYLNDDDRNQKGCSALGIGPVYMIRNERHVSGKLYEAIDMSGGFIIYDKIFPAGGRYFNFMWRIGPQFIYKISKNSSVNVGYMFMHISNGFRSHNPSYNAHGYTLGFTRNF